jgi:hypothetical protein
VKVITVVLIILEIALIAARFSFYFDDYISVVIIFLTFPLSYFAFHYLRIAYKEGKAARKFSKESFKKVVNASMQQTEDEVKMLISSSAFKNF